MIVLAVDRQLAGQKRGAENELEAAPMELADGQQEDEEEDLDDDSVTLGQRVKALQLRQQQVRLDSLHIQFVGIGECQHTVMLEEEQSSLVRMGSCIGVTTPKFIYSEPLI